MPETQAGIMRRSERSTSPAGFGVGVSSGFASGSVMTGVSGHAVWRKFAFVANFVRKGAAHRVPDFPKMADFFQDIAWKKSCFGGTPEGRSPPSRFRPPASYGRRWYLERSKSSLIPKALSIVKTGKCLEMPHSRMRLVFNSSEHTVIRKHFLLGPSN